MKRIMGRLANKCRRELSKRTSWYKRQKQLLFEVVDELEKNDISDAMHRGVIMQKLDKVSKNVILDNVSMAYLPFIIYLLDLKYKGNIKIFPLKDDCVIQAGGKEIARMSYLAVYIHFIDVKDDVLHIEGNVSWPTVFKDRCSFGVKNNGENAKSLLHEGGLDLKKGVNTYETRTAFSVAIQLKTTDNRITFSNYIDDKECRYGKINSMRFSPVADCIKHQYCLRDGWILYIEGNELFCEKATDEKIRKYEQEFVEELMRTHGEKAQWAKLLREEYFNDIKKKDKPIWLFMDRIDRADDNAEVLFKYVKKHHKDIDAYFIIEKNTKDYNRLKHLGNVIELNSRQHLLLVLMADYIISSQANGVVENPFWDDAEFFRDLYHQGKIIFLQHGVTKDDMSITLNRYNTNCYGFITSTVAEHNSFIGEPHYYRENEIWLTGLPRFDELYNDSQKYILLMPSWRKSLMEQVWCEEKNAMIWQVKDDFLQSDYVKNYNAIISSEKLRDACIRYGYRLAFMPHALMEPYIDKFERTEHCIYWDSKKSYREAFAEGDLLITDYSSVAFDFAYLRKPVIYYQFDKESFFKGHTYTKGYYDYERDGFGPVVYEKDKLIDILIEYMKKGCKMENVYNERVEHCFAYNDQNCCKRICDRLLNG